MTHHGNSNRGIGIALAILLSLTAPGAIAAPDAVHDVTLGAARDVVSPHGEAADLELRFEVEPRAALGSTGRRAPASDVKSFVARWTVTARDADGVVIGVVSGDRRVDPAVPGETAVRFVTVPWGGRDEAGAPLPDGDYRLAAEVSVVRLDVRGNGTVGTHILGTAVSGDLLVTVDGTPPAISIDAVPECSRGPVTPVVTVDDAHPGTVSLRLDGEPYIAGTPIETEGEHVLEVVAVDAAGNRAVAVVTFVVDRTPPEVNVDGVEPGGTYEPGVAPTWSAADPNLVSAEAFLDDNAFASGTPVDAPGAHVLVVVAIDCAGNETRVEVRFVVEEAAPTVGPATRFVHPDDPAWIAGDLVGGDRMTVFGSRDDAGLPSGVVGIEVAGAAGDARLAFDASGALAEVRVDGAALDFEAHDGLGVQWTLRAPDGTLRSTVLVPHPAPIAGASSLAISGPTRGGGPAPRALGVDRTHRTVDGSASALALSVTAPRNGSSAVVAASVAASGTCQADVRVDACGEPLPDARVRVAVTGDGPDGMRVEFPATPMGDGVYRWSWPCEAAGLPSSDDFGAALDVALGRACEAARTTVAVDIDATCGGLAERTAWFDPEVPDEDRRAADEACRRAASAVVAACDGARGLVVRPGAEEAVRLLDGVVDVEIHATDVTFGTLSWLAGVSASGPWSDVRLGADPEGGGRVTALVAVPTSPTSFDVTGRVACAPEGSTMRFAARLCDTDGEGLFDGCLPFEFPTSVSGSGSIPFGLTGDFGADVVPVTFGLDGGPSRRLVLAF